MQSKGKRAQTVLERAYVGRVKELPCAICGAPGPSEAHEPEQGLWFLSIPLCTDCHTGPKNGWHGQRAMWKLMKQTELSALNTTINRLFHDSHRS